jgi:predicted CopG family antitoxin
MKVARSAKTIRINEEQLRQLRAIAECENRSLADIFSEMAEEYISRHRETLSFLEIPGFLKECQEGLQEIEAGRGKIIELRK